MKYLYAVTASIVFQLTPMLVSAQLPESNKHQHIIPMPFPKQNLHPDTTIDNDAVVYHDATKVRLRPDSLMSGFQGIEAIPGDPGIMGLGQPLTGAPDRAFGALVLEQNPEFYPASANVRLVSVYPETPPGYSYHCSGALIDSKHILTAGHCVHKSAEGGWAETIDVYPAYNEGTNEFIGTAVKVNTLSWEGWTQNELYEHDMAIIELDRPVGALAGWLGYGVSYHNAADQYQTFGYPGDPYSGQLMYERQGTFDYAIVHIKGHPNYSFGGQSGSSSMDEDYYTYSCLSHGTNYPDPPNTGHTRIIGSKFNDIQDFIASNTPSSVDLVALRATVSPTFIPTGSWLDYFDFVLHNYSSADFDGTLYVNYYLSEDDYITSGDELLGSASYTISDLTEKSTQWVSNNIALYIPDHIVPGDYYLGVHVTNSDYYSLNNYTDYQDALPVSIYCGQPEAPYVNYSGNYIEQCSWDVLTLEAYTSCSDCEIYWSTGETGSVIYVQEPGEYTAVVVNACGNVSWSSEPAVVDIVYIPDPPGIEISGPANPCVGESITLTATDVCSGCYVYWSNGEWGESITVNESDTYIAYMSNYCGDSQGTFIPVTFEEEPDAATISASGPTSLCTGESVTLLAQNVCAGCDVSWSTGQSGASITVSTAGTFSAIVTNECGQSNASNSITVTTGMSPSAPVLTTTGSTELCTGQSATITASNVCIGCTVTWSTGAAGNSISVSSPGTYTASVANPCGQSPTSNAITITTNTIPSPVIISASGSTVICGSGSVTLQASDVCSGCNLLWSNGATGNEITVSTAGQYTAVASNVCGQSTVSNSIAVTVNSSFVPAIQVNDTCRLAAPAGEQYQWSVDGEDIPGATMRFYTAEVTGYYVVRMISDSGCPGESDALFVTACTITAVTDYKPFNFRIFPNPAKDHIRIEFDSPRTLHQVVLTLYSMDGSLIETAWESPIFSGPDAYDISIQHLPAGIYMYILHSDEGVEQGKVVIAK
jgi:V8-like Glu-specific endopeptidase